MSLTPGILPCQSLDALIAQGAIAADTPFDTDQAQPASLDLRLGGRVWRVRASFLPGRGRTVAERIEQVAMHELDLTRGADVVPRAVSARWLPRRAREIEIRG